MIKNILRSALNTWLEETKLPKRQNTIQEQYSYILTQDFYLSISTTLNGGFGGLGHTYLPSSKR